MLRLPQTKLLCVAASTLLAIVLLGLTLPLTTAQQLRPQNRRPRVVLPRTTLPQGDQPMSRLETLRSQLTSLRQENRRLADKIALIEREVGTLAEGAVPQDYDAASNISPLKGENLKQALADWQKFQAKVLAVVKPEIDPIHVQLAELDKHVHEVEVHGHSFGYAKMSAINNCPDCLIPFVSPENAAAEPGPRPPKVTSTPLNK
jgi:hypothetical protein